MEILSNYGSVCCFIVIIIGVLLILTLLCIEAMGMVKEPRNKVHFYVARDMDSRIYLYLGKPLRRNVEFGTTAKCKCIASEEDFKNFNLDIKYFKDIKWEDEPVEVFLNTED